MEEFRGLTAEMYEAIVSRVDDRLRDVRVTREGFERLQGAIARLAEAEARTEAILQRTEEALQELAHQCESLVCDIGEIGYIVLYDVLKREFSWQLGVLERTWQQWNESPEEINIFGRATDPAKPERTIWVVGEAKHHLTLRDVERFAQQTERARQHLEGQVYAVCFAYRARPEVRARLREWGIPLLFSYRRFA